MRLGFWHRIGVVISAAFISIYVLHSFVENSRRIDAFYAWAFAEKYKCVDHAHRTYNENRAYLSPPRNTNWDVVLENRLKECENIIEIESQGYRFQQLKVNFSKIGGWFGWSFFWVILGWISIYACLYVWRWVRRGA
jgi:hypothetical protein